MIIPQLRVKTASGQLVHICFDPAVKSCVAMLFKCKDLDPPPCYSCNDLMLVWHHCGSIGVLVRPVLNLELALRDSRPSPGSICASLLVVRIISVLRTPNSCLRARFDARSSLRSLLLTELLLARLSHPVPRVTFVRPVCIVARDSCDSGRFSSSRTRDDPLDAPLWCRNCCIWSIFR